MTAAIYSRLRPVVGIEPVWRVLDWALRVPRLMDVRHALLCENRRNLLVEWLIARSRDRMTRP